MSRSSTLSDSSGFRVCAATLALPFRPQLFSLLLLAVKHVLYGNSLRLPSYLHKRTNNREGQAAQPVTTLAGRTCGCAPSASRFRKTAFGNNQMGRMRQLLKPGSCSVQDGHRQSSFMASRAQAVLFDSAGLTQRMQRPVLSNARKPQL